MKRKPEKYEHNTVNGNNSRFVSEKLKHFIKKSPNLGRFEIFQAKISLRCNLDKKLPPLAILQETKKNEKTLILSFFSKKNSFRTF